jgi:hypothetical protein
MEMDSNLTIHAPQLTEAILTLASAISQMQPGKSEHGGEKMSNLKNPDLKTQREGQPQNQSPITFTQLQSKLIELSRCGMQPSIRAMLNYYGVKKLSELPKEKYEELYREVSKW